MAEREAMGMVTEQSVNEQPLSYGRQWVDESDIAAVVEVLHSDWLTQGPDIADFEQALAAYCGAEFAVAVSSGTAALHLACLSAGVGPGDTGITSALTFLASANSIAYCGGRPAFADVDPATITISPESLEAACRRFSPKVIIPVDFAGQPADLPAIQEIAKTHNAAVIEDAAHSLGAEYAHHGRNFRAGCCAHSDMAILSFHPVKHITTGEGGAILTNDKGLCTRLRELRNHGTVRDPARMERNDGPWYYEQQSLGFNYRITDVQCALGMSQLRRLPEFVERRRELVAAYKQELKHARLSEEVTLLEERPGRRSSYHLLVIQLRGGAEQRRKVYEGLNSRGIYPQVHYIPVHLHPWYRKNYQYGFGDYPHAEAYYAGCLSLPLFPRMSVNDVRRVVAALREIL